MIKLKELVKHECNCGKSCCIVTEDIKHITRAKKLVQLMQKDEEMRKNINNIRQNLL